MLLPPQHSLCQLGGRQGNADTPQNVAPVRHNASRIDKRLVHAPSSTCSMLTFLSPAELLIPRPLPLLTPDSSLLTVTNHY
jgi:hypothetical protein